MAELKRRKDSKNRVLKENESERADGTYQYRWRDKTGRRHCIYAAVDILDSKMERLLNTGM